MTSEEAEQLPIDITPERVCCPAHGEHFRANWPTGFIIFSIKAFQKVTENPEMWKACRKAAGLSVVQEIPPITINLVTQTKPFCYFLNRDDIIEFLTEAGTLEGAAWLKHQRCDICGIPRMAGTYSIRGNEKIEVKTVCLECACDAGERMHAAYPDGSVWPKEEGS